MRFLADERVLIVAPHPDDEVIGCGGLIAKVKGAGGTVLVEYMTVGDTADLSDEGYSTAEARLHDLKAAADFLGIDDYHVALPGREYHLRLDAHPQHRLIAALEDDSPLALARSAPTTVLVPQLTSYNQDHRAAGQAAMTALRPSAGLRSHRPTTVLCYEELADQWHDTVRTPPNVFVSLDRRHVAAKLGALEQYESQARPWPNVRSGEALESLARVRGAQAGVPYAEAYHCLRWVV